MTSTNSEEKPPEQSEEKPPEQSSEPSKLEYQILDETYQKYLDIKREINSIKRNINNKFNFENFSEENLQPLEIVSRKKYNH